MAISEERPTRNALIVVVSCVNRTRKHAASVTAFADDYVPGWVPLMDFAPVGRNFVSESPQFFLPITLRTSGSDFVAFETALARAWSTSSSTATTAGTCSSFTGAKRLYRADGDPKRRMNAPPGLAPRYFTVNDQVCPVAVRFAIVLPTIRQ